MRNSVTAIVLILAAVAPRSPANALSGPMPDSKLQNLVPTHVEQIRRFVARGPRGGGVVAVRSATVAELDILAESNIRAALRIVVHFGRATVPLRGYVQVGTGGRPAAVAPLVQPLVSLPPVRLRGRVHRRSLAIVGSIPVLAEPRTSGGMLAHSRTRPRFAAAGSRSAPAKVLLESTTSVQRRPHFGEQVDWQALTKCCKRL
jgi:hypothetical protein